MKRAILVFAAALLVLLSYPSTQSLAASKASDNTGPSIITAKDVDVISMTGDDDDGDADDILGIKNRTGTKADSGSTSIVQGGFRTVVRVWWNYLIFFR